MIDHFITLHGLKFHYVEWPHTGNPSTSSGQSMLLVHGFAGHALTWDVFAAAMSPHFRVIALDQRGHGDTDWASDYSTESYVRDLTAFIHALDLQDCVLVAHSMGGRNSMVYLNRERERVSKFVIVDTGPEMDPGGGRRIMGGWQNNQDVFDTREEAFRQLRAVNPRPPLEHHRSRIYHSLKQLPDGKWTWKYDAKLRRGGPRPSGSQQQWALDDWWQLWRNIQIPTLLVRGEVSDLLTRELAERMGAANPHCAWVDIAGAGHSVPMDRPVEFEEAVAQWLGL
jgi:pimeloyl-ACP methyl ester carboxylesterase